MQENAAATGSRNGFPVLRSPRSPVTNEVIDTLREAGRDVARGLRHRTLRAEAKNTNLHNAALAVLLIAGAAQGGRLTGWQNLLTGSLDPRCSQASPPHTRLHILPCRSGYD